MLIVCGTKAGVVLPEDALERVVQHGCSDVEEGLHRRPVPAHLLLLVHAFSHDLIETVQNLGVITPFTETDAGAST